MIDWLASYPKSGNTWIRCLVAAYFGCNNPNHFPNASSQSDLKTYNYHTVSPIPLDQMSPMEALGLRNTVLEHIKKWPWGLVKTHNARIEVEDIHLIPKRVTNKAIYLVRDPRDIAPSFSSHLNSSNDHIVDLMGRDMAALHKKDAPSLIHLLSSWSKHVDSWMKSPFPTLCVKYETLLDRPEDQLFKILDFLDLDPDREKVYSAVQNCNLNNLREIEEKEGFKESKDGKFFGGERNPLTEEQKNKIEQDHGEVMQAIGYI